MKNANASTTLQELCALVAKESDPRRLAVLLDQLIEQLDSHRQEAGGHHPPSDLEGSNETAQ